MRSLVLTVGGPVCAFFAAATLQGCSTHDNSTTKSKSEIKTTKSAAEGVKFDPTNSKETQEAIKEGKIKRQADGRFAQIHEGESPSAQVHRFYDPAIEGRRRSVN